MIVVGYTFIYSVSLDVSCTYCGRNTHLKEKCDKLKRAKERHVNFVRSDNNQEMKEWGPDPYVESLRYDKNVKKVRKGPGRHYHCQQEHIASLDMNVSC